MMLNQMKMSNTMASVAVRAFAKQDPQDKTRLRQNPLVDPMLTEALK